MANMVKYFILFSKRSKVVFNGLLASLKIPMQFVINIDTLRVSEMQILRENVHLSMHLNSN